MDLEFDFVSRLRSAAVSKNIDRCKQLENDIICFKNIAEDAIFTALHQEECHCRIKVQSDLLEAAREYARRLEKMGATCWFDAEVGDDSNQCVITSDGGADFHQKPLITWYLEIRFLAVLLGSDNNNNKN